MLKDKLRNETFKTLAVSAGLVVAIAASGAFLVARAAPAPGKAVKLASATFKSKSNTATFAASCGDEMTLDMRPDPAWVGQSFAKDDCWAPKLPAFVDGYAAYTTDGKKVEASMAQMEKYIVQAHVYQKCIASFVVAKRAEADSKHVPVDKAFLVIEDHRLAASKANEKKVATQVEITIAQYNENGSACTDGGDIVF